VGGWGLFLYLRHIQGCQMVYFHTKNANYGKLLKAMV
jgi:hypothetical protein